MSKTEDAPKSAIADWSYQLSQDEADRDAGIVRHKTRAGMGSVARALKPKRWRKKYKKRRRR